MPILSFENNNVNLSFESRIRSAINAGNNYSGCLLSGFDDYFPLMRSSLEWFFYFSASFFFSYLVLPEDSFIFISFVESEPLSMNHANESDGNCYGRSSRPFSFILVMFQALKY